MSRSVQKHAILPVALSAGLMVLLVAIALIPNVGALPAATSCQYGGCDTPNNTSSGLWYGLLAALVIVAIALGLLLLMRRRRAKPGGSGPVEPWAGEGAAVGVAGGAAAMGGPPDGPEAMDVAPEVPAGAASYTETPEDVGTAAAAGAAGTAAAEGGEADIDSLMQELDKISGEILKKGPPQKKSVPDAPTDDEGTSD